MDLVPDWDRLDAAAYRVSIRRSVRLRARILAVVGAVAIACGVLARFVPLVALGGVLLAAGLWNLRRPSVAGLLVDGTATILTGVVTLLMPFANPEARTSLERALLASAPQLLWGFRRLASWWNARHVVNDRPAIARLEELVRDLTRRDARSDPSIVELRTGWLRRSKHRLALHDEGAVALFDGQAVRLDRRSDVWLEPVGSTTLGRTTRVKLRMGEFELAGEMPASHVERFERWKVTPGMREHAA